MLLLVIFLSLLLGASILFNVLLYKAGLRKMEEVDILSEWVEDFRLNTLKAWNDINFLDSKGIFQKDDEVGVIFQDILDIVKDLNEKTQEETEENSE